MKVTVRLFAAARQFAGADAVELELPAGGTIRDLRAALAQQVPAMLPLVGHLQFAVGSDYVAGDYVLEPGQQVACIPPVSGG